MKKPKNKLSIFQIVSIVLIAIFVVAIIVQIGIIIGYKQKAKELDDKNKFFSSSSCVEIVRAFENF